MKHVPNILSVSRIILTLALFFLSLILTNFVFSPIFLMLYAIIGLTDILDGFFARRFSAVSQLGANIDGIADYILIFVSLVIIVPQLDLNTFSRGLILGFIALKIISVIVGYIHYRQLMMMHTLAGKIAGLLAFSVPLVMHVIYIDVNTLAIFVGTFVYLAMLEKIAINIVSPEPLRD
ncbi:MAG: CDP-alcohol phosphatidyltransferase family protein, partial [Defluviitaleaceae bacterium]|nr:CDP-alcohol phosphatidyltransferase family protein [Defluviitaleaceae bacterium]